MEWEKRKKRTVTVGAQGEEGLNHHRVSAKVPTAFSCCPKRQVQPPHTFADTSDRPGWPNEEGSPLCRELSLLCWVQG